MKKYFTFLIIVMACVGCKKDSTQADKTASLSSRVYIKDYKQEPQPAQSAFYLIKPKNRSDVQNSTSVQKYCPDHSIIAFTSYSAFNLKGEVPPGDYILVVQVSPVEKGYNWYRYSYKDVHIVLGDHLVENMTFSYEGKIGEFEAWTSN